MPRIHITLGALPGPGFDLPHGVTTVGQSADNDVVLPLPDVAEHHARIECVDGAVRVVAAADELLLCNGRPVAEAALGADDVVAIGPYALRVQPGGPVAAHPGTLPTVETDPATGLGDRPARRLAIVAGPDARAEVFLDGPRTVVGRAPDCDLVLADRRVSWHHAALERRGALLEVRDLGSRNGTFLGGHRVSSAPVGAGSEIVVGRTTLRLLGADDPAPGAAESADEGRLVELVGSSRAMQDVYRQLRLAAASTLPVLLLGETGTGKELAARAVHALSARAAKPFVALNCAAIPRDIIESELFGHVRGAFTGSIADRAGAFERARGGTLFLDELGELPIELQAKLLRALEVGEVTRLGGNAPIHTDARLVSATNRDPERALAENRLRSDLYYRVAVLTIRLPPLRERRADLRELIHEFLKTAVRDTGVAHARHVRFEKTALTPLEAHDWPGNVRELRNLVHHAVVLSGGSPVTRALVERLIRDAPHVDRGGRGAHAARGTLEELERAAIVNCLRDTGGNRRQAARRLGIAQSTLYDRIRRYRLE